MVLGCSLSMSPSRSSDREVLPNRVLDHSQTFDFDTNRVPGIQETWRIEAHSDPVRRTREDQVAGPQSARLCDEVDQLLAAEEQVRGAAVLPELPVDPRSQA